MWDMASRSSILLGCRLNEDDWVIYHYLLRQTPLWFLEENTTMSPRTAGNGRLRESGGISSHSDKIPSLIDRNVRYFTLIKLEA